MKNGRTGIDFTNDKVRKNKYRGGIMLIRNQLKVNILSLLLKYRKL